MKSASGLTAGKRLARPTGKRLPLSSIQFVRASMKSLVRKDLNRELLFLEIGKARASRTEKRDGRRVGRFFVD